jgi:hypothetical protein
MDTLRGDTLRVIGVTTLGSNGVFVVLFEILYDAAEAWDTLIFDWIIW